jgi:hypothetical protein
MRSNEMAEIVVVNQGDECAKQGDLVGAIDNYTQALTINPACPQTTIKLENLLANNTVEAIFNALKMLQPEDKSLNLQKQCLVKTTVLGKRFLESDVLKNIEIHLSAFYKKASTFNKNNFLIRFDSFQATIAPKLSLKALNRLSLTCKSFNRLFKETIPDRDILQQVAYGEQIKAENRLKPDSGLALKKNIVTDYSFRTFNNISAVQYAAWALDMHMLRMLIKDMTPEQKQQALAQINELEKKGTEFGTSAEWILKDLIDALNHYVANYDNWTPEKRRGYWIKTVGGLQRLLPAHFFHEYCHPNRPFDPLPTFDEPHLPRAYKFYNLDSDSYASLLPLSVDSGLGFDIAIVRRNLVGQPSLGSGAVGAGASVAFPRYIGLIDVGVFHDAVALAALCKVRIEEFAEIKKQLQNPSQEPKQGLSYLRK